jgi:hypothetical protein
MHTHTLKCPPPPRSCSLVHLTPTAPTFPQRQTTAHPPQLMGANVRGGRKERGREGGREGRGALLTFVAGGSGEEGVLEEQGPLILVRGVVVVQGQGQGRVGTLPALDARKQGRTKC